MAGRAHQRRAAVAPTKKQQPPENHSLDKTRVCRFFAQGLCSRGGACSFAHGQAELVPQPDLYRTGLCFDYLKTGYCWAGAGCKFAHSADDLRLAVPVGCPTDPAPSGRAVVARQVQEVQQKAAQLMAQLQALRQLAAARPPCGQEPRRGRPTPAAFRGRAAAAGVPGGKAPARHAHDPDASTDDEEHQHSGSGSFARQVSEQAASEGGSDEWEAASSAWQQTGGTESPSGSTRDSAAAPLPEPERFVMPVKNTSAEGSTGNSAAAPLPKPERFVIHVKNTFVEVEWEPVVAPTVAPPRARSAPAGRRCRLAK